MAGGSSSAVRQIATLVGLGCPSPVDGEQLASKGVDDFFSEDGAAAICATVHKMLVRVASVCQQNKSRMPSKSFLATKDEDTNKTQSAALQKIAAKAGSHRTFYASGCERSGASEPTKFAAHGRLRLGQGVEVRNAWVVLVRHSSSSIFSEKNRAVLTTVVSRPMVQFLRPGAFSWPVRPVFCIVTSTVVFPANGATHPTWWCIQLAHSAGALHCDLRRSKFCHFCL